MAREKEKRDAAVLLKQAVYLAEGYGMDDAREYAELEVAELPPVGGSLEPSSRPTAVLVDVSLAFFVTGAGSCWSEPIQRARFALTSTTPCERAPKRIADLR